MKAPYEDGESERPYKTKFEGARLHVLILTGFFSEGSSGRNASMFLGMIRWEYCHYLDLLRVTHDVSSRVPSLSKSIDR